MAKPPTNEYFTPIKKRTSIGRSPRSRPKNKNKRRQYVKYRGEGREKVYMLIFMLKENVVVRCERKVQRVHQKHLTLKEQNKQREKNND